MWGRRRVSSVDRLAGPTPYPGEEEYQAMRSALTDLPMPPGWPAPVPGFEGCVCSICTKAREQATERLADEIAALPKTSFPTAIVSITAADGTEILDLQVTGSMAQIRQAILAAGLGLK